MLRIDTKRLAANLMFTTGNHRIEENIPYFAIEPTNDTIVMSKDKKAIEASKAATA